MAKKKPAEVSRGTGGTDAAPPLPPGVKLLLTLESHQRNVRSLAFDPLGGTLASGGDDNSVTLWEQTEKVTGTTFCWRGPDFDNRM
ncbi:MAG: WD40 repeat domain-containing protein [Planctomycetota bacterium]